MFYRTGCRSPPLAAPPSLAGGPAGQRGPSTLQGGSGEWGGGTGASAVKQNTDGHASTPDPTSKKKKPVAGPGGRRDGSL